VVGGRQRLRRKEGRQGELFFPIFQIFIRFCQTYVCVFTNSLKTILHIYQYVGTRLSKNEYISLIYICSLF
jgi:hypothetical protein